MGLNMEQAATKLGLTRANFYYHLTKAPPDVEFLQSVRNKLGIALQTNIEEAPSKPIPFYDMPIAAGKVQVFNDNPPIPSRYIQVPGFEDCDFSKVVYGHSMYPTYENGCIVACKEIKERSHIRWGEAYYVCWGEYEMLKRLQKGATGKVLLCSDNDEKRKDGKKQYEPIEVPAKDITRLYLVRLALKPIA